MFTAHFWIYYFCERTRDFRIFVSHFGSNHNKKNQPSHATFHIVNVSNKQCYKMYPYQLIIYLIHDVHPWCKHIFAGCCLVADTVCYLYGVLSKTHCPKTVFVTSILSKLHFCSFGNAFLIHTNGLCVFSKLGKCSADLKVYFFI